ncbi:MAG: DNA-directed RNA polymerase subunit beta' [Parcubacteria group bacterium GW2011_GWA2_43_17]|nr:MAG: DNA-directed RNA polymerase subunit beta' [Parcubacteria group bacterium GW2011_GWA2_43_17]KKT97965.1 MAG: DNA-directed RNA polymerase subunit beta' [Parcubacteria group bacterium GW2011_GWC2_45_15]OGY93570.1 MAG: DNA-directed RNA polymerase subunit beta' [Candidatus Komeilibacteria bacterium RIFOXYC2_FULL_45_12]HAH04042.1 DNA-directed RNA polymerase subunit beta' [Candidatus Komeilibacteria bacterium]HBR13856.1 DNA-directed RNA polymerase subunit beta' [Candidatus Komeilibacteria bacte
MPTPSSTKTTFMPEGAEAIQDFTAIRLTLASPEVIHKWSHGEVLKPETINYRTQKPEKDGLFCEKIFGPSKDWECYCGKYRRIRYKGIVCDKCGVEVTRSIVRRERMGHIDLAAPVSHIWFLRGIPSKVGLVLNLSIQELEKVIYFASFIITRVNEDLKEQTLEQINNELKNKRKAIEREFEQKLNELNQKKAKILAEAKDENKLQQIQTDFQKELNLLEILKSDKIKTLENAADTAKKELKDLKTLKIISETKYRDLSLKYGHVFEAGIGAGTIRKLLEEVDLEKLAHELNEQVKTAIPSKKKKLIKRAKLVSSLITNKIRPEWMILSTIPVIPPDLRPMVQLDGGRFATSDLNDLYRRVINRNNRLKRLKELKAPEVIQRNEKRMLQEAVDALIDNSARHSKTVTASTGQKRQLKSIADMLKGKQGRFRQNLLGKRIDYSGRSVIVIGPKLKMYECGLPKTMALELFRPFVISELIKREIVHNVRSANKYIEQDHADVWDILEGITNQSHVLLNRAPTLHRLGIQAFKPILIEGKAIQIHPMVCRAFNADFDGDQMAVHVPLTDEAKEEASHRMLASNNLLKPATGDPMTFPDQDIVWGCYYLTFINPKQDQPKKYFASPTEAKLAHKLDRIRLHDKISVRLNDELVETTVGRLIFNEIVPDKIGFVNEEMNSKKLKDLVAKTLNTYENDYTVEFLDKLKKLGYETITYSGLSWGMNDVPTLKEKKEIIKKGETKVEQIQDQYEKGLLTNKERYVKVVEVWTEVKNEITKASQNLFDVSSSLFSIINSGARGSWAQMIQIMGMKGLVINPAGEIIELPVKANFQEGLDVLEYFISTHGTRKGLSDTALRTASAGYLTRRLVDVAQDVIINEDDCGDTEGLMLSQEDADNMGESLQTLIFGRTLIKDIKHPKTGKALIKAGEIINNNQLAKLKDLELKAVHVRSLLSCKTLRGACKQCYGLDLAYNKAVEKGVAAGIIAAQSIGEPGTQLTMRTFHTGGVAGADITQGLPRVEELFEARPPKRKAIISDVQGQVVLDKDALIGIRNQRIIKIKYNGEIKEQFLIHEDYDIKVKDGDLVEPKTILMEHQETRKKISNSQAGQINIKDNYIQIISQAEAFKEVVIPPGQALWVKDGDLVSPGDPLTEGSMDLQELYRHKGMLSVQKYIIKEILYIYSSQGQKLNMKHIEIIVKQMFSRVYVKDAGDTNLLPGETVTMSAFNTENNRVAKTKGKLASGDTLLLGITKASLSTDSFLSAASFQETARVLIDAAITGKVDKLKGLKENVIIGRLIPAGTGFKE